jgi:hypothetical protein
MSNWAICENEPNQTQTNPISEFSKTVVSYSYFW